MTDIKAEGVTNLTREHLKKGKKLTLTGHISATELSLKGREDLTIGSRKT